MFEYTGIILNQLHLAFFLLHKMLVWDRGLSGLPIIQLNRHRMAHLW